MRCPTLLAVLMLSLVCGMALGQEATLQPLNKESRIPGRSAALVQAFDRQLVATDLEEHTCVIQRIRCGQTLNRTLEFTDCELDSGVYGDLFDFRGTAGDLVQIDVRSTAFDPAVGLIRPGGGDGSVVATDDDSGVGTNARLTYVLDQNGLWNIGLFNVVPFDLGSYSLSLQCTGQGTPPAAPTNARASNVQTTSLDLLWSDNSNDEDGFQIQTRTTGSFQTIGTVGPNSSGVSITDLTPNTTYDLRVRAFNDSGNSAFSNVATAKTLSSAGPPTGPCVPGPETLCLRSDRFRVTGTWRTQEGETGPMRVVAGQSDDSANLWFFEPGNWELLVKVLDGCPINNRFWVFFAATTNVQFELSVIDTQTGTAANYFNPLGQAANAVTDTSAFSTCP